MREQSCSFRLTPGCGCANGCALPQFAVTLREELEQERRKALTQLEDQQRDWESQTRQLESAFSIERVAWQDARLEADRIVAECVPA